MKSMKKGLFIAGLFITLTAGAQQDTLKYRINLADKAATTYSLKHPEKFLSQKALDRRSRQNLSVDSTDLPVCKKYIEAIRETGVNIVVAGKWENFVTVSCNDSTQIDRITELPFVRSATKVWKSPKPRKEETEASTRRDSINQEMESLDDWYGVAHRQIALSNGDKLHEAGFKGQGMTIAVIDGGFHNADSIPAMQNIEILGTKDFVNQTPSSNVFTETSHGMMVLSCMAMNQPYKMVGTAPEASYYLIRSEDDYSEYPVEEDYASAAYEYADSLGVDVINTSLGYYDFDDKSMTIDYRALDGKTSVMSRTAARLADKGIVLVCSAGNSGTTSWKKITPPGDARNVLTVGAIGKNKTLAPFSSVGTTADGRIKPDVVAVGWMSDVMSTHGNATKANGTSFASPILCGMVACLWQALPKLTAKEIIELVKESGDRAKYPDNIYGWGVPDVWKAYNSQLSTLNPQPSTPE